MVTLAYQSTRWSLSDLFESQNSPDMQAALAQMETLVAQFESHRERLQADISVEAFMSVIQDYEAINHLARRVYGFAGLSFAADTQDQTIQAFMARIDQLVAELENRTLFFSLWWKALDEAEAGRLMAAAGDYRYWLEEMRRFKPHTLSEAEEKIVNIKNVTGVNALSNLYDSITNRYTFKLTVDGEEQELTRGEVMVYARSNDPELRSASYQELYRIYGDDGPILGQIYQTMVRDWRNEQVELRHYASPIAARNLSNDIPDEVVDTLLNVCQRNAGLFQRFFQLKARLLGMARLRRYDIYAPVVKADKSYEFGQAAGIVMDSFQRFDLRFADLARRVFEDHHLDSEVRKGKRSGAFCWTVIPEQSPWVLLNYQGRPDDVATMAHELGHAIHSMLAEHHTIFTQQASLPLAETASTFGEMMLVDRLLADEQDEAVRRDLLFKQVDDAYATILRQAFFALFERQAHALIKEGASINDLSKAYQQNLQQQFGEAVELSDEFRWEWVSIPHIYHTPFYVYAYAFGQLLVLSLYRQFREEGEYFKPRYIEILSAGGSDSPASILSRAGIDIYRDAFWQGGFDVVSGLIGQLEVLTSK
jgi:oligoendopeptidase F